VKFRLPQFQRDNFHILSITPEEACNRDYFRESFQMQMTWIPFKEYQPLTPPLPHTSIHCSSFISTPRIQKWATVLLCIYNILRSVSTCYQATRGLKHLQHQGTFYNKLQWVHTYLIPFDQTCLLRLVSTRTSGVPIIFSANFFISLIALGARLLNPLLKIKQ